MTIDLIVYVKRMAAQLTQLARSAQFPSEYGIHELTPLDATLTVKHQVFLAAFITNS